ncbi:MAG: hypothetical protein WC799_11815 [Desulfobacteraceae bacterium]|jgi:hypothetical protein
MSKKGAIVNSICLLLLFGVVLTIFAFYFHIMLPYDDITLSGPDARAYRLDKKYIFIVWRNRPFIINPEDRYVGEPSDYRNRVFGRIFWPLQSSLVFWPRGSYEGVQVGDGVKGDRREKFDFVANKVHILAFFSPQNEKGYEITIELPNAK